MALKDVTGVARALDLHDLTNRAIAIITVLVGIIAGVVQLVSGSTFIESTFWAIKAAGSVFLAWALSRELDPDYRFSAFVSSGLTLISLVFANSPSLLALIWCLLVVRILNQTTGLPATVLDAAIALGSGILLAVQSSWVYIPLTVLVFFLNWLLQPGDRRQLVFAEISLIVGAGLGLALRVPFGVIDALGASTVPWLAITIVFIPVIFASGHVKASADFTGEPLNPLRLQAAQVLVLLTAILTTLFAGIRGALSLLPLWMAFLGLAVYRIGAWILGRGYYP